MKKSKKKGFTLIELIAVIAILAILGLILVPNVLAYRKKAEKANIETSAKTVLHAIDAYNADKDGTSAEIGDGGSGDYPGTMTYASGIAALEADGTLTSDKIPDCLKTTVGNVADLQKVINGSFDVTSIAGLQSSISLH